MSQQNSSEEVDLGYLLKKSNDIFKNIAKGIFKAIDFFIKNIIWVVLLIIVGVIIGFYKDYKAVKSYDNQVIVIPNFESVDYLYDKVEAINSKIAGNDTVFLRKIFNENVGKLGIIEIEPIVDIYNFISQSRENIDILRILAQNQDFSEYIEDISTSKYYKYHRLKISITGIEDSEKIINDLFVYLNENEHFKGYQDIFKETKAYDIQEHYKMISQVDSLVKASTRINDNNNNVSVSTNSDQHYLIERKRLLIDDIYHLKMELLDYSSPIKIVNIDYNLKKEKLLEISNKVKYPIFLLFAFSFIFFIIHLFKTLRKYSENE
jgi:hypothetical protein